MPEFDLVAPVYDSTRRPPSAQELQAVTAALKGVHDVFEGGIGTGRYALPLQERGFRVTGADISREMLHRARGKGLQRLVMGDLHRLPFPEDRFDASLIVHVLQLIPEPALVLRELSRVARSRVVAVLPDHGSEQQGFRGRVRGRYAEIAKELGYELPPRRRYWENSEKVVAMAPPDGIEVVEEEVERDPDREARWRDLRSFGGLITVPPEVHEQIVARLRAERPEAEPPTAPRKRILRVVRWESHRLRELLAGARSEATPTRRSV